MDQPTYLKITVKGKIEDVRKAVVAAQKRVDLHTVGFDESKYVYESESDFKEIIDKTIGLFGEYKYTELKNGTVKYAITQDRYGCVLEEDIKDIAKAITDASPNVKARIVATITSTFASGYDLRVDIKCANGKFDVDTDLLFYDDEEDDDY